MKKNLRNFFCFLLLMGLLSNVCSAMEENLRTTGLIMDSNGSNLYVLGVIRNSSADKAGVKKGDVITGYRIGEDSDEWTVEKAGVNNAFQAINKSGQTVYLKVSRGSALLDFQLKPEEISPSQEDMPLDISTGKVDLVKGSSLYFVPGSLEKVNSEDEYLIFKNGKYICKRKIRMDNKNKRYHTYALSLPLSEMNELQGATLIFYNHSAPYYINKSLKKK